MKKYLFVLAAFSSFSLHAFCQQPACDNFEKEYAELYKEATKNNQRNIFEAVTLITRGSFSKENPLFEPAIAELVRSKKITEAVAVHALMDSMVHAITEKYLWSSSETYHTGYKKVLDLQTTYLCDCQAKGYDSRTARVDRLGIVLDSCNKTMATNQEFQATLKQLAPDNNINNLRKMMNYFSFNMYEKCTPVQELFNLSFFEVAETQYYRELAEEKMLEATEMAKSYAGGDMVKLKLLFPAYSNYNSLLKELKTAFNTADAKAHQSFRGYQMGNDNSVILYFQTGDKLVGSFLVKFNNNNLASVISSIEKFQISAPAAEGEDRIEEIREDQIISTKKN